MIAVLLSELAAASSSVVAAADSGGGTPWLLLLGPAGAVGVYYGLWQYYRNTDQSHAFERETRITAQPVTGQDTKIDEITGTKKTGIDGDNRTDHRERVQRVG
jgi:hypothetical protein